MSEPPRLFDRRAHAARLARAARVYEPFLKARAAGDLVQRLAAVNRVFDRAVDLGARDGVFARALAASEAAGRVGWLAQADLSPAMLARAGGVRLAADEARPPFAEASLDLVVSSLALHWLDDLVGALVQIRRALRPDGLFLGALFGGATLSELRGCLTEAEIEIAGGAGPRVSPFLDAADAGGLLQRAGFALPVVDVDTVSVRYAHPLRLLADLRAMGETNVLLERPRRGLSRAVLARACQLYAERFSGPDGKVTASFEILTLTGWAPHPGQPKPLPRGSGRMPLGEGVRAAARLGRTG